MKPSTPEHIMIYAVYVQENVTGRDRLYNVFDTWLEAYECKRICEHWSNRAYILEEQA